MITTFNYHDKHYVWTKTYQYKCLSQDDTTNLCPMNVNLVWTMNKKELVSVNKALIEIIMHIKALCLRHVSKCINL